MTMDQQDVAALDSIARQTERLWHALSKYVAKIEGNMQVPTAQPGDVGQAARVLPPGAAQVRAYNVPLTAIHSTLWSIMLRLMAQVSQEDTGQPHQFVNFECQNRCWYSCH